jgi:hypothetical protein
MDGQRAPGPRASHQRSWWQPAAQMAGQMRVTIALSVAAMMAIGAGACSTGSAPAASSSAPAASSSAPAASSSAPTVGGLRPLPSHLFGLSINTGPAARRIADRFIRIADQFIGRLASQPGFRSPQVALYGRVGSGPAFLVYGARLTTQGANPASELSLALLFVRAAGITKGRLFTGPPGPHGGAPFCGRGIQSGVPRFVCGWADKVTAGQVLYVSGAASSLSDAAAKTNQVRALIEP